MKYKPFGLSVSTYSFNQEYYNYTYSLEDILRLTGSLGTGTGLEFVASMFDRSYPLLSPEIEHTLRSAFDKYGLVPVCYSGYADPQRAYGKFSTDDEKFEFIKIQLDAAKKLGFQVVRIITGGSLADRFAAYCEKIGIQLCTEIHAFATLETSEPVLESCRKHPGVLGICLDLGTICRQPSSVYYKRFAEQGVPQKYADMITELWRQKIPPNEMHKRMIEASGGDELVQLMTLESNIYFAQGSPAALKDAMPYLFHVHGKFYNVDENGHEDAVRYPEVVHALQEAGYDRYMTSEYEGHHWNNAVDSFEQIRRHQKMIRGLFQ